VTNPETPQFVRGAIYGTAAVSIWAGWIVVTRLGVTTSLTALDITALRFGVAGLLLLPVLLRRGLALDRLGWIGLVALAFGGGAPFVLLVGAGLVFAPAAHAGALFPGVMPLFVALLASAILKEPFPLTRKIGLVLILSGALVMVGLAGVTVGGSQSLGDILFLGAAFLWACYTVSMRRARLGGLHAAAIAAVISMIAYFPVYLVLAGGRLLEAPLRDIALQGIYQGVLTMIVSLFLYGRAVNLLGASGGAAFGALAPAMATLIAIPVLGEWPAPKDWMAILLVSGGVYLVSGAPLRSFRRGAAGVPR
jgi:drug/metabolite transporter (DMT)-like permease